MSEAFQCSIVVLDMVHFTKGMSLLETLGLPRGTHAQAIDALVVDALSELGLPTTRNADMSFPSSMPLLKYTGDGAIFHFIDPSIAVQFGEKLQELSMSGNQARKTGEKLLFRVGIGSGAVEQVNLQLSSADLAGSTIGNAARLEAACKVGDVTIDSATYLAMSSAQQQTYSHAYTVKGKSSDGKGYWCHSRCINTNGEEDYLSQPGWRFFRDKASILRAIESRLRESHPEFNASWSSDLKQLLQVKNNDLVTCVRDHLEPHEVIEILTVCAHKIPGSDVIDSGLDELMLFAACRCVDFAKLPSAEHVGKSKEERFAVVTRISTDLDLVINVVVAGFCGVRLHYGDKEPDQGFTLTIGQGNEVDVLHKALQELYAKVMCEQPPLNRSSSFYAGEISRWFKKMSKPMQGQAQLAVVNIVCAETEGFHREIAINLAKQINHIVNIRRDADQPITLEIDDSVSLFHARIHNCLKALLKAASK